MNISSRTPEGEPFRCSVCGEEMNLETSPSTDDGCCPRCGQLLWWFKDRLAAPGKLSREQVATVMSLLPESELDSMEVVELVMEVEEVLGLTIPDDEADRIDSVVRMVSYLQGMTLKQQENLSPWQFLYAKLGALFHRRKEKA